MTIAAAQMGNIQGIASLDGVTVGTLTTRTSSTQGVFTFTSAAPIQGTETIALFWNGGYVYDCTINSFTGVAGAVLTVTFTVPGGQTALPVATTAGLVSINTDVTNSVSIVGSDLQMLLITSTQPGLCELLDSVPTQRRLSLIAAAGGSDVWPQTAGQAVPFSQTIVTARMYNNSQTQATMTVVALLA
jgi:hypothetical protein